MVPDSSRGPGHERRLEVVTAPPEHSNPSGGGPTVARVRRAIFARHCNPWSAWTRWASTPLTLVPLWTRRWNHAALIALWFAVNPFVFGKPAHQRAWSTRVAATALGQVDARSQNRPIARAIGTYVAGIVRRNSVPITTHDHQSLSLDMTLAP